MKHVVDGNEFEVLPPRVVEAIRTAYRELSLARDEFSRRLYPLAQSLGAVKQTAADNHRVRGRIRQVAHEMRRAEWLGRDDAEKIGEAGTAERVAALAGQIGVVIETRDEREGEDDDAITTTITVIKDAATGEVLHEEVFDIEYAGIGLPFAIGEMNGLEEWLLNRRMAAGPLSKPAEGQAVERATT